MIGDVLTSSILLELLREHYPEAQLDYLVNDNTLAVIQGNPFVDNIKCYDAKKDQDSSYKSDFTQQLKAENYDLIVDVYAKLRSARLTRALKPQQSVSYYKWYTQSAYKKTVRPLKQTDKDEGLALVNRALLLETLGIDIPLIPKPKIYIGETEKNLAEQQLSAASLEDAPLLFMIAAFGSGPDKTYPLDYMAQVLDDLVQNTEATLLFNYLPHQKEQLEQLIGLCKTETQKQMRPEVYGKSLREFLALASCTHAVIGNEGGAVNMGKALNVPTFSIFSPWILKSAWNSYESSGYNQSIHLSDIRPERYKKHPKKYKRQAAQLYRELEANFVIEKLRAFTVHHAFSASKP